jgi:4-amino-4-deoxy-L-arabinose transferase-like glycosyltransferase
VDRNWKESFDIHRLTMAFRTHKLVTLQILLLIGVSFVLRLADLGYSNLQGDEILTLCRVSDHKSPYQLFAFLLRQAKGPVQYLITCAFSILDPTFSSELALRLPFAIANLLALTCFFLLVYRLFTLEAAIYSTFLLAANGIFIAFARIVQYQSFVILGGVLGILSLALTLKYERWRVPGLYVSAISAAMSLLAHFDAAFFIPPMMVLILHWWLKLRSQPDFSRLRRHLIAAAALFAFLVLAFYAPYVLRLGPARLDYWENRFTGDSTNILKLFQFYNPGPVVWFCLGFVGLGFTRVRQSITWQVTLAWLLPPLVFMAVIFNDSRTHAYTYMLPLLMIAGVGIDTLIGWIHTAFRGRSHQIAQAIVLTILLIFSYISYSIFIDHDPEYPWYPKRVLGMEMEGGFVAGTFGFPYSREWREIGSWFQSLPANQNVTLVTNEKRQIATFYLPSRVHNRHKYSLPEFPGEIDAPHGIYVLIIHGPQNWLQHLWGLPLSAWQEKFVSLQDFANEEGRVVASIYFLTPEQIVTEFH